MLMLSVVFDHSCFEIPVVAAPATALYLVSSGSSCSHLAGVDAQNTDIYLKDRGHCGYLYRNTTPLQRTAIPAPLPKYFKKNIFVSYTKQVTGNKSTENCLKYIHYNSVASERRWCCPYFSFPTAISTHTIQRWKIWFILAMN